MTSPFTETKGRNIFGTSPSGIAIYPHLTEPDTAFNKNEFNVKLSVPLEEAKPFMKELADIYKAHVGSAYPKSQKSVFYLEEDRETGEETGNVVFNFKVKNREDFDRRPKLFFKDPDQQTDRVGGGSRMKVRFQVYKWEYSGNSGITLQPTHVLVEDVKEYGPSMSDNPFDEGVAFEPDAPTPTKKTGETDGEEDTSEFF